MPKIHKVECGRCGTTEDLKEPGVFEDKHGLPDDWRKFNVDHAGAQSHLCPDCWDKYLLIEEEFLSKTNTVNITSD